MTQKNDSSLPNVTLFKFKLLAKANSRIVLMFSKLIDSTFDLKKAYEEIVSTIFGISKLLSWPCKNTISDFTPLSNKTPLMEVYRKLYRLRQLKPNLSNL